MFTMSGASPFPIDIANTDLTLCNNLTICRLGNRSTAFGGILVGTGGGPKIKLATDVTGTVLCIFLIKPGLSPLVLACKTAMRDLHNASMLVLESALWKRFMDADTLDESTRR